MSDIGLYAPRLDEEGEEQEEEEVEVLRENGKENEDKKRKMGKK